MKLGSDGKATVSYAEYAWDSNKLNGKGYDNFVTSGVYHTDADLNNPSFNKAYIAVSNSAAVVPQTDGSDSGYWHIMFFPYSGTGGGSGTQIAMPFSGNKLYMRSADGGRWSEWTSVGNGGNADTVDGKHAEDFVSRRGDKIADDEKYYSCNLTPKSVSVEYSTIEDYDGEYGSGYETSKVNITKDSIEISKLDSINDENGDITYGIKIDRDCISGICETSHGSKETHGTIENFKKVSADKFEGDGSKITNVNADTVDGKHAEDFADSHHTHTSFNQLDYVSFRPDEYFGDYWIEINHHSIYGRNDSVETDQLPVIKDFSKISAEEFEGNGRGLTNVNADTVDGKHAEDFIIQHGVKLNCNVNTLTQPGEYYIQSGINLPDSNLYGYLKVYKGYTDKFILQMFTQCDNTKSPAVYTRKMDNGSWGSWSKVCDGGNADTVDGKHASAFALSSHAHTAASTSSAGFMSAADKVKLDGIAAGANKITVDSALSASSANPVQNKAVNAALSLKTDGYKKVLSFTASAGNWYRIINTANASRMCGGVFTLSGGKGEYWSNTVFSASQSYTTPKGANKIASITHSYFNGFISKLRLVNEYGGSNQYIDVYVGFGDNLNVSLTILFNGIGWEAVNSVKTANTVDGYTVHEIILPQED